jgi:hypothetical protein
VVRYMARQGSIASRGLRDAYMHTVSDRLYSFLWAFCLTEVDMYIAQIRYPWMMIFDAATHQKRASLYALY